MKSLAFVLILTALFSTSAMACDPRSPLCKKADKCQTGNCDPYPKR